MEADKDGDGKISFEEFCDMVASTVSTMQDISLIVGCGCQHDSGGSLGCGHCFECSGRGYTLSPITMCKYNLGMSCNSDHSIEAQFRLKHHQHRTTILRTDILLPINR